MSARINLTTRLAPLADRAEFPDVGTALVRWGQLLRTPPAAATLISEASLAGRLVPLRDLARVRSGVVTRANAYFLVEELPFDEIPNRFRVTRRDLRTVAVFVDGKAAPHRIDRKHLRPVLKGPDSLIGPMETAETNLRLVDIRQSPDELRSASDNDTLAYIRRGETVEYSVSADKLKGGIPAKRSNIKNRKPHWYSLNVPDPKPGRLVIPEHFDQRFIVAALQADSPAVVIDKLYVIEPKVPTDQPFLLAALNSLLTWFQIELRGRTQLGEGVLETKIPDLEGIIVLDPRKLSSTELAEVMAAFHPLAHRRMQVVQEELELADRAGFDATYLSMLGIPSPRTEEMQSLFARELREAMSERRTRSESVADLKAQKAPKQKASRAVDAFAARIVAGISPYPDPRHHVANTALTTAVSISPFEGALSLGDSLFDAGKVFAGSEEIAAADDADQARFVRAVLTIDPQHTVVDVPTGAELKTAIELWTADVAAWWDEFVKVRDPILKQITDPKLVESIGLRALELAHASETPDAPVNTGPAGVVSSTRKRRSRKAYGSGSLGS